MPRIFAKVIFICMWKVKMKKEANVRFSLGFRIIY